jgi:hypothetical protein
MSYLEIKGLLRADGYMPKPGREHDRPPAVEANSDRVQIHLRDASGRTIGSANTQLTSGLTDGDRLPSERVHGVIELVPGARHLVLGEGEQELWRADVAPNPPAVDLEDPAVVGRSLRIAWSSSTRQAIASVLIETHPGRLAPLAARLGPGSYEFDLGHLPAVDEAHVVVIVSDWVRSSRITTGPIPIPGMPARCSITRPGPTDWLVAHQPVALEGAALESDGMQLPSDGLEWRIDDRVVARGTSTVAADPLVAGRHFIELRHRDVPEGADRREIEVAESPGEFDEIWSRDLPEEWSVDEGPGSEDRNGT